MRNISKRKSSMALTMGAAPTTATQDAHPAQTAVQVDTTRNLNPVDARRMARRAVNAAGLGAAGAAMLPAATAASSRIDHRSRQRHQARRIPRGNDQVDPRTAIRLP